MFKKSPNIALGTTLPALDTTLREGPGRSRAQKCELHGTFFFSVDSKYDIHFCNLTDGWDVDFSQFSPR